METGSPVLRENWAKVISPRFSRRNRLNCLSKLLCTSPTWEKRYSVCGKCDCQNSRCGIKKFRPLIDGVKTRPDYIATRARNFWIWLTLCVASYVGFTSLLEQSTERYSGFFGHMLAVFIETERVMWNYRLMQALAMFGYFSFFVTCYKAYWKWVGRVLVKHGSAGDRESK